MIKKIIFVALIFALSGCATTANYQQVLSQWQGTHAQALINSWGYPDGEIKLPNGNTVYMYIRHQLYSTPTYPTPTFTSFGSPIHNNGFYGSLNRQTMSLYCRTWFEVNPQNVIVNSQFEGNNCVANKFGK